MGSGFAAMLRPGMTNTRSVCLCYECASASDVLAHRIGVLGERNGGSIVLPCLLGLARLLSRLRRAEGGAEPVRLLLESCLESSERFLCHAALEQHGAIELTCRRQRAWRNRMLVGLVLGVGGRRHG